MSPYSRPLFYTEERKAEERKAEERLYKEIFYEEYKRKHEAEIRNKIKNQLKTNDINVKVTIHNGPNGCYMSKEDQMKVLEILPDILKNN